MPKALVRHRWVSAGCCLWLAAISLTVGHQRGVLLGVAVFVVAGLVVLPFSFAPAATRRWWRRHSALDSAVSGPIVTLNAMALTDLSMPWCLLAGLVGYACFLSLQKFQRSRRH